MTTIKDQMTADMRTAMKGRDAFSLGVLRTVLGEIATSEKSGKTAVEFDDAAVMAFLGKEVKKRRETAEIYAGSGHQDRADVETREADLIAGYLPTPLTDAEVEALVESAITDQGATTLRDMGKVVKAVLESSQGRADGKTVSTLVKARLAG